MPCLPQSASPCGLSLDGLQHPGTCLTMLKPLELSAEWGQTGSFQRCVPLCFSLLPMTDTDSEKHHWLLRAGLITCYTTL